jgi:hypothetical protein
VLALIVGACTFPPLETPSPEPSPTPSPSPTPTPSPSSSPSATPLPTPDIGAIPGIAAGQIAATTIDGLRVRQRPGLTSPVLTGLLPLAAELGVVMGPVLIDGQGWYLVIDADAAEPQFEEGWIASGFEPEAFLVPVDRTLAPNPYLGSFAQTGAAEFGPIEIVDERHAIRWLALDPEAVRCQFEVFLEPSGGEDVRAIGATIGTEVVPGTLQPSFFSSTPSVRGQVFVRVAGDCAWTLVVVRIPEATPQPSATP